MSQSDHHSEEGDGIVTLTAEEAWSSPYRQAVTSSTSSSWDHETSDCWGHDFVQCQ